MDTFSQILKALAVRCYLSEERTWKQAETADFSAYDGVRLLFVFQGCLTCTFRLGTDPVTVQAGEALALFRPSAYRLQSSDTEDTLVAVGAKKKRKNKNDRRKKRSFVFLSDALGMNRSPMKSAPEYSPLS